MKALIIGLIVVWLVLSLLGAIIEGLLWLAGIGLLLLVATAVWGWFKLKTSGRDRV